MLALSALHQWGGVNLSIWGPTQKEATEAYDGVFLRFSPILDINGEDLKTYVQGEILKVEKNSEFTNIIKKPIEETTIAGLSGYTFTSGGLGVFRHIYLRSPEGKSMIEIINTTADPTGKGFAQTADQILSTFKFTK